MLIQHHGGLEASHHTSAAAAADLTQMGAFSAALVHPTGGTRRLIHRHMHFIFGLHYPRTMSRLPIRRGILICVGLFYVFCSCWLSSYCIHPSEYMAPGKRIYYDYAAGVCFCTYLLCHTLYFCKSCSLLSLCM